MTYYDGGTDFQKGRAYAAEDAWADALLDIDAVLDIIDDEDEALAHMGEEERGAAAREVLLSLCSEDVPAPVIRLDLTDDDLECRAGYYRPETDTIHMHPRLVTWKILLHELAHWLDWRQGHGPRFTATHVDLVNAKFGEDAARALIEEYRANDVGIDWRHCGLMAEVEAVVA